MDINSGMASNKKRSRGLEWTKWLRATLLDIYVAALHIINKDPCLGRKFEFFAQNVPDVAAFHHLTDRSNCFHLTLTEDHEF